MIIIAADDLMEAVEEQNEQEISEPVKKKKRYCGWYCLVLISVPLFVYLLYKPLRLQICDQTNFCFNTCDTYTGFIKKRGGHAIYGDPSYLISVLQKEGMCENDEAARMGAFSRKFWDMFKPEITPENTTGLFMTKDGIYRDGVFLGTFENGVLIKPEQSEPIEKEKTGEKNDKL